MDNQRSSLKEKKIRSRVDVQSTIGSYYKTSKSRDQLKKQTEIKEKSDISRFNVNSSRPYSFEIGCRSIPDIQNGRSYAGSNRLLNRYRKVNFYLFDLTEWEICTNNPKFFRDYGRKKDVFSSSAKPNVRFKLSSLLSQFFYTQTFIPNRIRNKYFNRLRDLLLVQYHAIEKRLNNENKIGVEDKKTHTNRRTKTYIRFSYKNKSCYFGIFKKCTETACPLPCAYVMSENRTKCPDHVYILYQNITKNNRTNGKQKIIKDHQYKRMKYIECKRLGIEYTKVPYIPYYFRGFVKQQGMDKNVTNFNEVRIMKNTDFRRIDKSTTKRQDERLKRRLRWISKAKDKLDKRRMNNVLENRVEYWTNNPHHKQNKATKNTLKEVYEAEYNKMVEKYKLKNEMKLKRQEEHLRRQEENRKYASKAARNAAKKKQRRAKAKEEKERIAAVAASRRYGDGSN